MPLKTTDTPHRPMKRLHVSVTPTHKHTHFARVSGKVGEAPHVQYVAVGVLSGAVWTRDPYRSKKERTRSKMAIRLRSLLEVIVTQP